MLDIASFKQNSSGIYIHFPYCIHKCSYCDFYSIGIGKSKEIEQKILFENYKKELIQRIQYEKNLSNYEYDTIFIGGGTPSMANLEYVYELISFIKNNLPVSENFEFTMEANPEDISKNKILEMKQIGVNRLNVGVQSFQQSHLITLDRFHDAEKYDELLSILGNGEIERIGIDLMYGIPNQSKDEFYKDLNKALQYNLKHISLYSLTAEKGTDYYRKIESKKAKPPEEDLQFDLLQELPSYLEPSGYEQYEVSNFAKENNISKHNMKYWKYEKYLSIGPAASGFTSNGRYTNSRSIENYLHEKYSFDYELDINISEFALCILRLFCKIDMYSYKNLFEDKFIKMEELFLDWSNKNLCTYQNGIFQWNKKSILDLDSRIFELSSI